MGDAVKWGRPASPRPAGLGLPPISQHLLVDAPDHLSKSVMVALVQHRQVWGRPASPRLVGLALARLGSPLLCHIDHKLHIASQVGLGLGSLVFHCKWTQSDLAQAFRSQLIILVQDALGLA